MHSTRKKERTKERTDVEVNITKDVDLNIEWTEDINRERVNWEKQLYNILFPSVSGPVPWASLPQLSTEQGWMIEAIVAVGELDHTVLIGALVSASSSTSGQGTVGWYVNSWCAHFHTAADQICARSGPGHFQCQSLLIRLRKDHLCWWHYWVWTDTYSCLQRIRLRPSQDNTLRWFILPFKRSYKHCKLHWKL